MPTKKKETIKSESNQPGDVAKAVVEQKRKRGGNNPTGKNALFSPPTNLKPGTNAKIIKKVSSLFLLPKIDHTDPEQVEKRIAEYFEICQQNDMKPMVGGLALALGVDRMTLYRWAKGEVREKTHCDLLKRAYQFLNVVWEEYLVSGNAQNQVGLIFLGKNYFGYVDRQEVVVEPQKPLGDIDADEARKELDGLLTDGTEPFEGSFEETEQADKKE